MRSRLAITAIVALVASSLLAPSGAAGTVPDDGPMDLDDGRRAVELDAPVPDWYTPALHRKVTAAGRQGVPVPADAPAEYSNPAFAGIRPGAWIISPAGCTTNFVFGSAGSYHIGTAGHCTEVGDEVTLVALPGVLMTIGRTVVSVDEGVGRDFALIEVYPEMQDLVNPSMSYFGGPSGDEEPSIGDVVVHSGHGLVIGTGGTARAGLVTYVGDGDPDEPSGPSAAFGWDGAASPGDSGSAVRNALGAASGNLTHLVVGTEFLPAFIAGTTASLMESLAGMPIASASLVPDPL